MSRFWWRVAAVWFSAVMLLGLVGLVVGVVAPEGRMVLELFIAWLILAGVPFAAMVIVELVRMIVDMWQGGPSGNGG